MITFLAVIGGITSFAILVFIAITVYFAIVTSLTHWIITSDIHLKLLSLAEFEALSLKIEKEKRIKMEEIK